MTDIFDSIQTLHQQGFLKEARIAYVEFLKQHPNHPEAWHGLGILSAQEGLWDEAIQHLEKAISLKDDEPALHLNLANAFKMKSLYHAAITSLQKAIALDPSYSAAFNNLGTVYFDIEKWDEAILAFEEALALQEDYIDAHYNLGLTFSKAGRKSDAIAAYQRLLKQDDNNAAALFQLGCLFLETQQAKEALTHFLLLEKTFPEHFETQCNLATAYLKLGDFYEAKTHYLKGHALNPEDTQTLFNVAVMAMQEGHPEEAIHYYQKILSIREDFATHNNLGLAFLAKQERPLALQHFEKALRFQPNNRSLGFTVQALSQNHAIENSPPEYIQNLFDAYADHYDRHLQKGLHYQIPQQFLKISQKVLPLKSGQLAICDIGAGTGLCGEIFKPYASSLCGIDLSPKMLEIAKEKGLYDELIEGDLCLVLEKKPKSFDLILAGDVLVYLGDFRPTFKAIRQALKPQGTFIFNTEISDKEDFSLKVTGRFSHSRTYVESLAKEEGFEILHYENIPVRMQNNEPVQGHLFVLQTIS